MLFVGFFFFSFLFFSSSFFLFRFFFLVVVFVVLFVNFFSLFERPSNTLVYFRDGRAQVSVHAAKLR